MRWVMVSMSLDARSRSGMTLGVRSPVEPGMTALLLSVGWSSHSSGLNLSFAMFIRIVG